MRRLPVILTTIVIIAMFATAAAAQTSTPQAEIDAVVNLTPPRLSLLDGQVSFWRPGAEDWVEAQINIPLAPGDQLYSGAAARMEMQIGAGAFFRGASDTQIGFEGQGSDYLHFSVTEGHASLDVRTVDPGFSIVVDTPTAAFTLHSEGYYRIHAGATRTTFITRKGGQASAVLANGETLPVAPDQEVTIAGLESPVVKAVRAPAADGWDSWNYARTDRHLNAESARYVSAETYGLGDLDKYGTWKTVPTYGRVWAPADVGPDWVPYSTGAWVRDPYYGWTWVDTAPWGWAPYHYGRWVFVNNVWVWAPGPIVRRPVYAPALVAFYGYPGVSVSVGYGGPVGWVALGWGEPLVPWWGGPGFIHRPWWGGWGGPRVVNNVVISYTTVVHVRNISTYRNVQVRNSVVTVPRDRFGRGSVTNARLTGTDTRRLQPLHTAPYAPTRPSHFAPSTARGTQPPRDLMQRSLVSGRSQLSAPGPGRERAITTGGRDATGRQIQTQRRPTAPSMERQAPSSRQSGRDPAAMEPERGTDNRSRPSRLNENERTAPRGESPAVGAPGTQRRAPERPESRSRTDREIQAPRAQPPAGGAIQRPRVNEGRDAVPPPTINRSTPAAPRRSTGLDSMAPQRVSPPSSAPAVRGSDSLRGSGRNPAASPPGGLRSTPQQPLPSVPAPARVAPRQNSSGAGSRGMVAPGAASPGSRAPSGRGVIQQGGSGR